MAREVSMAKSAGATIIAIATSANAMDSCLSELHLRHNQVVQLDYCIEEEIPDKIVDVVLARIYPLGSLQTFADNFRMEQNLEEAEKCDRLFIGEAEKSPSPNVMGYLADCYRNGRHGLSVDLKKESEWLSIAIHEGGRTDLVPRAREVNTRLYQMEYERRYPSLLKRIKSFLKRSLTEPR
jgi:hypothetical protein